MIPLNTIGFAASRPALRLAALFALLISLSSPGSQAYGETTSASGATAITSVPCAITTPGAYYLAQDFSLTDSTGIGIYASNVTLDFNGHTITQTPAANNAMGVYIGANFENVTVRNGTLKGFTFGVLINSGCNGARVEEMCVSDTTSFGIACVSSGTLIRRCRVIGTGGPTGYGYGIHVALWPGTINDVRIIDCDVSGVASPAPGGVGIVVGRGPSTSDVLVIGNRISGYYYGINYTDGTGTATGKYRDNTCAASVVVPYTGGTDAGGNN